LTGLTGIGVSSCTAFGTCFDAPRIPSVAAGPRPRHTQYLVDEASPEDIWAIHGMGRLRPARALPAVGDMRKQKIAGGWGPSQKRVGTKEHKAGTAATESDLAFSGPTTRNLIVFKTKPSSSHCHPIPAPPPSGGSAFSCRQIWFFRVRKQQIDSFYNQTLLPALPPPSPPRREGGLVLKTIRFGVFGPESAKSDSF
jgi:hypothetical protein